MRQRCRTVIRPNTTPVVMRYAFMPAAKSGNGIATTSTANVRTYRRNLPGRDVPIEPLHRSANAGGAMGTSRPTKSGQARCANAVEAVGHGCAIGDLHDLAS